MSTVLALLCKQASYPGRGAAIGTVAGGLAGYGLADEDQRVEGAALGAAAGGLGGYGLGRAYLHRPLGPAITDNARLLGAGGEGAAELEELRRAYPTRKSLLETAHSPRDRSPAATAPTPANLANRRLTQGVLTGSAIGGATAAGAADEGNGLEAGARGAFGGAFIGGAATLPYLHHLERSIKLEEALAKAKSLGVPRSAQRKMQVHVDDVRGNATRAARIGAAVGVPVAMAVGAGHATDVNEEHKTAAFGVPNVILQQSAIGTGLGAAGGALAAGEGHRQEGAVMGATVGGLAGLGTGSMAHRAYNAAHAPLAQREHVSKLVQKGVMDQTPSPLGRAMVAAQGDDARRTIREGVTQAAQDSSKMTRRVGAGLGTLGAMGVAETLRAQPKTAAILDAIFQVH